VIKTIDATGTKVRENNIIKKNIQILSNSSKVVGQEINVDKNKSMFMYCHQNAGQNHIIRMGYKSFENFFSSSILEWQ
jgi:hypothetical protein